MLRSDRGRERHESHNGCIPRASQPRIKPGVSGSAVRWRAAAVWGGLGLMLALLPVRAAEPAPKVEQVVVVFKTHFDIGYTDMASNVVARYRTSMIDQALGVVDQNRELPPDRQFVWTLPGWPLHQILADWPGQSPNRRRRVLDAFRQGRFVVHALPFTTHTELLEAEDLVRGLGFATRLSRDAGLALPRDAKMTDVPCHSWILPTLLRHAGVDFLHLGCNAASRSPRVPALFWWEGPDGSRLLTMYTAESYGTDLVPPAGWPHKTWLALTHTGDNHGPPTPDEVRKLMTRAAEQLPGVKIKIGRLSDFADALLAEHPTLPVVRGDMPDTWIHGPMCDPAGAALARTTRPDLVAAEALNTLLPVWGIPTASAAPVLAEAFEQSLLYGEHTWGGALWWVSQYSGAQRLPYGKQWREIRASGKYERIESSWAEHTAYIERAHRLAEPLIDGPLQSIARAARVDGPRLVVFNPLPWRRDGEVILPDDAPVSGWAEAADGSGMAPVANWAGGRRAFVARHLPPMGYRAYRLVPFSGITNLLPALALQSAFFEATVDPARGTVRSLVDRRSGRQLIDTNAPHGFGQFLYERFSSNEVQGFVNAYVKISADWATNELGKPNLPPSALTPYQALSPRVWTCQTETLAAGMRATMAASATPELPAVTTRLTLYSELPYADLELTVHEKPADPWPEAGWLCLPFQVTEPRFRLGRLGSIIDPVQDVVPNANRHLFGIDTGVTITDHRGRGVGLCSPDLPLVSLDTPGCWKFSSHFLPRRPTVYLNLFNNQWTTNFRLWNQGTWTTRVRIWSVSSDHDLGTALVGPSLEARFPLRVAFAAGAGGTLPAMQSGLEVSRPGVRITAFGAAGDDKGTVLRLWEYAGQGGHCTVRLPGSGWPETVQPIDLRGRPAGEVLLVRNGTFTVPLKPFAPVTVRLR
jgi:hypothetical protein